MLVVIALLLAGCGDETPTVTEQEDPCKDLPLDIVETLAFAYRTQDLRLLTCLLANDPENNAEFLFFSEQLGQQPEVWGYTEELKIHRRMFTPADTRPGEVPVARRPDPTGSADAAGGRSLPCRAFPRA